MNSQYKIKAIFLKESEFKRSVDKVSSEANLEITTELSLSFGHNENQLNVEVGVKLTGKLIDKEYFTIKVAYLGIFEIPPQPEIPVEQFANINAPAIIFPYVREHITNLTVRSLLPPIILPPVNFVELARQKQKKNET